MFVVNKNSIQTLYVNMSDEAPLSFYIFALSGNGLTAKKIFNVPLVVSNGRYHQFTIEENPIENLTNGIVSLPKASDLYCEIYNTSTDTLAIPADTDPIWRGLWRVYREATVVTENTPLKVIKEYDPRQ
jgi:hypothetical protein